jgi:hypothetical protein
MIDLHGDPLAAGVLHHFGGLFNRFGTVVFGTLRARGSPSAIHSGSSRAEFDSDTAARAARCPCDQRHFALQYLTHHPTLFRSFPPSIDAQRRNQPRYIPRRVETG